MFLEILAFSLLCVVFITLLYRMEKRKKSQQEMRSFRLSPEPNEKMADSIVENWIGKIHGMWYLYGGAIAGLKYIYQAWQKAPQGSIAKFGWGALLAIIIAVGLLVIIRLIDQRVNGREAPVYTQTDDLAAQIAIRQMGEKIDPINR